MISDTRYIAQFHVGDSNGLDVAAMTTGVIEGGAWTKISVELRNGRMDVAFNGKRNRWAKKISVFVHGNEHLDELGNALMCMGSALVSMADESRKVAK